MVMILMMMMTLKIVIMMMTLTAVIGLVVMIIVFRTRYSKGVSAVETILLVDRLRQQATQSSLSSPPCIFNHLYYNQL